jgi:hypothetical protein
MYEALKEKNVSEVQEVLMTALETVKFGRDNFGCPESNSDVEPPALYIRAILDLGYLTYREFAFLLWKLEDLGANYTDTLKELKTLRGKGQIDLGEEAKKYIDCKPIMILVRWGFLAEDTVANNGGKHIIIPNDVLKKFETRLRNLKVYNIDMDINKPIKNAYPNLERKIEESIIDENKRLKGGINVLLYGVPGCGKSHTIKTRYCKDAYGIERVVFHPDYTYGDFVGQIMPMTDEETGKIRYEFSAGPFTRILSASYNNPDKKYCLVVEEINRGNAPAIFGDIFQMLDREDDGSGSYDITNVDVADKVYIHDKDSVADSSKIKIPSNLYIYATMNTSDQNVFTLDTAFQRRWNMRMVENDVSKSKIAGCNILDTSVKWAEFNEIINGLVILKNVGMTSSEDKRLGAYFVTENDLHFFTADENMSQEEADDRNHNFPEKVLKYLWDDAFKFTRDEVFKSGYDSLEKLIKGFETAEGDKRFDIFLDDIFGFNQDE